MTSESGAVDFGALEQAFRTAAGELGLADAAWRFVAELDAVGGEALITEVRNELGTTFPVLDAVCGRHLEHVAPIVDVSAIVERCQGLKRLVLVGLEARWADALLSALPTSTEIALMPSASFPGDAERMLANLPSGVSLVGLDRFQRFAGPRSGLLTFVYGRTDASAFVVPEWVRCQGPDVRSQFRSFLGWNVLGRPPDVYPRWLIEVPVELFTSVVP